MGILQDKPCILELLLNAAAAQQHLLDATAATAAGACSAPCADSSSSGRLDHVPKLVVSGCC
jgi:hypothetical protein